MPDMPWPTTPDNKPVPLNQLPKTTRLILFKQAARRVAQDLQDQARDEAAVRRAFNEEYPS